MKGDADNIDITIISSLAEVATNKNY